MSATPLSFLGHAAPRFVPLGGGMVLRGTLDRRSVAPPEAPDVLGYLEELGFQGSARDDLRRFAEILAPLASTLLVGRCAADDTGNFAVSVHRTDRPGPRAAVGDEFFAGAQFSGHVGSGVTLVEPHLLRQVCLNGAAVFVRGDVPAYVRWSESETEGDLETIVETGFSPSLTRLVEFDLRRARVVPSPRLAELRAHGALRVDDFTAAAIKVAAGSEEPTLFGFYNAMTRVARDHPDLRAAVSLARSAGRLLSVLTRSHRGEQVPTSETAPV